MTRFEKEPNRNSRTEKFSTKIMSSTKGYKSSLDTVEESISEVEDKSKENIQNEEQRIKLIEYTEVRIRKRIIPSRKWRCRKKGKTISVVNMWVNLKENCTKQYC